jgi:hypothetical protein
VALVTVLEAAQLGVMSVAAPAELDQSASPPATRATALTSARNRLFHELITVVATLHHQEAPPEQRYSNDSLSHFEGSLSSGSSWSSRTCGRALSDAGTVSERFAVPALAPITPCPGTERHRNKA